MMENVKNPNATKAALERGILEHKDLLSGDCEDTYCSLTAKLFYAYRWAVKFCDPTGQF